MVKKPLKCITKTGSFLLLASILYSCGGSDGPSSQGGRSDGLSGTAAIGAPLSNARITVIGQACKKVTEANANGIYSVGLSGCEGPYLVRASSPLATVHSVARSTDIGNTVNITPLTEIISARTLGTTELQKETTANKTKIEENIENAKKDVQDIIRPIFTALGETETDILNGSFSANGDGLDKVLDTIDVRASSTTDMKVKVKGSTSDITIKAQADDTSHGTIDDTEASTSAGFIDNARDFMKQINNCLGPNTTDANRKSCFTNFTHPTAFVEDGLDIDAWWTYQEIDSTEYPQFSSPVLLDYEKDGETFVNLAHFMVKATWYANGSVDEVEYTYVRLRRDSEDASGWKIAGNGVTQPIDVDSTLVLHNGNRYRVLNIEHNDANVSGDDFFLNNIFGSTFNLTVEGDAITVTGSSDSDYEYLEVPSASAPNCSTSSNYCKHFIDLGEGPLPNFLKVQVAGVTTYVPAPAPFPEAGDNSDFPSFNIQGNDSLCGTGFDTAAYPDALQKLSFSIPSGHILDNFDIGPVASTPGFDFNVPNYWETTKIDQAFGMHFVSASQSLAVSAMNASLTSANDSGLAYTTIYGCRTP